MRVAVLGAGGMLGRAVVEAVEDKGWTPLAYTRTECDITNVAQIHAATLGAGADAVINCAGIVPGRGALTSEMIAVNALGPWLLAECVGGRVPVIHVSTDCVFCGDETDRQIIVGHDECPDDAYGRSKLLGEADDITVVRTSFIGPDHGLLAWLIESAARGELSVEGWSRAWWSGSTVWAVARGLVAILRSAPDADIYHLSTEAPISKMQALRMCARAIGLDIEIVPCKFPEINRALDPTITLPPFEDELAELAARCAAVAQ